jgi:hypothetical protein
MNRARTPEGQRIDVGDVTLVWGDRARWKAALREESRARHMQKPIGERLRAALELVRRRERP